MNYFIDSNVILGYIFTLDNIHYYADNFFSTDNYYFCSNHVDEEVSKVFHNKNSQYQLFLLKLSSYFNQFNDTDLINELDVHDKINSITPIGRLKVNEMHDVLDKIWNELNFDENHDSFEVKLKFHSFQNDFLSSNNLRKHKILNELIIVPNHKIKDKIILDLIKKEGLGKYLHDEDENILFDSNEFCKNNLKLNLQFVSADQDFLKVIEILKDYLCIKEYINVMEFNT